MSTYAIKNFHSDLERLKHFGGTSKETAIRFAFQKLLDEYAKSKDLMLIPEVTIKTKSGKNVTPDGTLKDILRLDHGYWESKDEADDIDEEIRKKFAKGYPNDNIIFEDSQNAVLIQHGEEVGRVKLEDEESLDKLLNKFIGFERPEITDFRKAIEKFREDIPKVTETLHDIIEKQDKTNSEFKKAASTFHEICKQSINPEISVDDIKEMMVQHILSADIFNTIFDEPHFHQENNIARELNKVIDTFFTGTTRRTVLATIQHYYQTINAAAASIADHHEKQMFLKVVYENFYKAYNPKAADRLGIVYTPNEIVQFMIKSSDYLLHKHFGKTMADKNVEILDPATGTGTFICDIIDFLPKNKVELKYKNELHANELAILPYYIANLNIEYTFKQKMGTYSEFENLCLVDTLDNTGFHWVGKQGDLFGVSAENAARIRKQNQKKISLIIGNPPYNAKQENYNYQNANRVYKEIDKRIKDTYIKEGSAQNQIVLYDMYVRFFRWATDRIQNEGIVAFVSNNSFVDGKTFDGFRKVAAKEFSEIYIINLKGNARTAGERRKQEGGNVFSDDIRVGVAVYFFIKRKTIEPCNIFYNEIKDYSKADEKKAYLSQHKIETLDFDHIVPDAKNNWIKQTDNNWDELLPLIDKNVKAGKSQKALFKLFSAGIKSQRDEWVYDFSKKELVKKMTAFINVYRKAVIKSKQDFSIKWDRELSKYLKARIKKNFDEKNIVSNQYRPFVKKFFYFDKHFNGQPYQWFEIFRKEDKNSFILINSPGNTKDFFCMSANTICDLHLTGDSQCLPLFRYTSTGERIDNITDWALEQFITHYKDKKITKENIFHYSYAVLHHPTYRKKYELNLKREPPRIPFYGNFKQWVRWGHDLMELHNEYEKKEPYKLILKKISTDENPKVKLKSLKESGIIQLDDNTELQEIPKEAWDYKLGNLSALEWVLDQYEEKNPRDQTIAENFNTYKFTDYKEQVIDLLKRVCTVSTETMKIINSMPG